jgi:hypothetical protein
MKREFTMNHTKKSQPGPCLYRSRFFFILPSSFFTRFLRLPPVPAYIEGMTIEQTVEIPANHRLTIEVPPEIPAGKAILAFTPAPAPVQRKIDPVKAEEARKRLCGMGKTDGYEVDRFMAGKAAEKALEL